MVIFGVTGDLTRRKLIPSLYNLASEQFYARVAWSRWTPSTDEARKKLEELNRLSA
jgi:glucose-6-phosphate 1-dehydrogenase